VPGLLLAAAGALAGWLVHLVLPGLPWLTASLLVGVLAGSVPAVRPALDTVLRPGLGLAAKRLLRLGIVLLGLRLSLTDVASLGWVAVLAIVALVAASFVVTWLVARAFRLEGDQPVLLAAGFSICGVSAVGAMSAARNSPDRDTATPVALVTLFGTLAIVVLPVLGAVARLDAVDLGRWIGASVHDVGQVVATAGAAGTAALSAAVVVKLTRVLMLAPMVAAASIATRRSAGRAGAEAGAPSTAARPPIVPLFVAGFVVAVLIRTFLPVPDAVLAAADLLQSALLAAALFAIGATLRLERLARSGIRSVAAGLVSWAIILTLALLLVRLT
jgi:uncharacterized integral membrane protein (TIGR00698 family)